MNKKEEQNVWKCYKNSYVKIFVEDLPNPYPRKRIGIFLDSDDTHIFLKVKNKDKPVSFSKQSIKRTEEATAEEYNANY